MLQIDSRKYTIDRALFEETIGVDGFDMYLDMNKYSLLEAEISARYYTATSILSDYLKFITLGRYKDVSPTTIGILLEEHFNIGAIGFLKKTSRGISLDMTKVIQPLREYCKKHMRERPQYYTMVLEFCNLYIDYSKLKQFSETLKAKRKRIIETDMVDNFGNKLSKISSLYERQSTGRYYTSSDNLQGWNLESVNTFTAPKDYFFVWADFDQIDLRVAANLVLFNDHPEVIEQFDKTADKYEAIARIMSQRMDKPFDEHKFKANRKSYKTAVLARLYGASKYTLMQDGFTDMHEMEMLDAYYRQHKYYQKYVKMFERAIAFNTAVMVEDYFGYIREIPIPQTDYAKSEHGRNRVLEQCLNTPIQSTSNDIVMLWVNELTKLFRTHGFGLDKFRMALLRHDEGVFLVHKDCIPYLWLFQLCSSIYIDSWSELTVKPKFGYNYKVTDEALAETFENSVQENLSNLITHEKRDIPNKDWYPCKSVASATFYAPMSPARFAYSVLSMDENWAVDAQLLKEKIESNSSDAMQFAKQLINSYREQAQAGNPASSTVLRCIEDYNKYYNICVVELHETREKVKLTTQEFIPYLLKHDVGYVYLNNTMVETYAITDGIQLKYTASFTRDEIVRELNSLD